jgi:hypothetical protein
MIIQARFGVAQTGVGYRFYNASGSPLGSRVTTGITALPETGGYVADATVPDGAVGVYWDTTTAEAVEDLRDALAIAAGGGGGGSGLSEETAAALEAAEQIFLAAPFVPDESPVLVIPAPADASLTVVYIYTEDITNQKRAGIEITLRLVTTPAKSERVLEIAPATMTTAAAGYAQITVQRGHRYRVTSRALAFDTIIATDSETLDLATIV